MYIERIVNNKVIYGWGRNTGHYKVIAWTLGPFSKELK